MSSKGKPNIGGDPCVTVTTKQYDKAQGRSTLVELRALRKGEHMMVTATPGQIVELKVIIIPAKPTRTTQLLLKVTDDRPCLRNTSGRARQNDI
jgi:hypothetical protein